VLADVRLDGVATATGAGYVAIENDAAVAGGIRSALAHAAGGKPVIVDVRIDYSKRTRFTQGVVGTVLKRFPLRDKVRFVGRALFRKLTG
jgi:acetolactate synthase-1/2/3 large subunit